MKRILLTLALIATASFGALTAGAQTNAPAAVSTGSNVRNHSSALTLGSFACFLFVTLTLVGIRFAVKGRIRSANVGSRADAHGVLTIFGVIFSECHLPRRLANDHAERPSMLPESPNRALSCSTNGVRPHVRNAHAQAWWEWFVPPFAVR